VQIEKAVKLTDKELKVIVGEYIQKNLKEPIEVYDTMRMFTK